MYNQFSTHLMKAYEAETTCNQVGIHSVMYMLQISLSLSTSYNESLQHYTLYVVTISNNQFVSNC